MCKVSELIEFLKTVDPDTEVEVLQFVSKGYMNSTSWEPLELGDNSDTLFIADYADRLEGGYAGKKVIFLGED